MRARVAKLLAPSLPAVLAVGMGAALATAPVPVAADDDAKTAPAVQATSDWLGLVDAEKYAESWSKAAELFRATVAQAQWVDQAGSARKPLGKVQERTLRSKTWASSLPGAPDGEYVVAQYATTFANKKAAVETVTAMKEKDGRWAVAGYFVR